MELATAIDVEAALGRSFDEDVTTLLEEASDLVVGYLNCVPNPVPGAVMRAVATMVAASLNRPSGLAGFAPGDSLTAGPYTARMGDSGGVWLTNALKLRLRPYRCGTTSVRLQSELYEDEDEEEEL